MHWAKKRELTPEEVMKLPPETEVHLEGLCRHEQDGHMGVQTVWPEAFEDRAIRRLGTDDQTF